MHPELAPHQSKALSRLDNGKILWGGVGTGKSRVGLAYYMQKEAPKPIYVITTAKKRDSLDWEGEAAGFGIGKEADATVAGVLTVDSWNNIGNYTHIHGAFFIFDEQRLVGSGKWTKAFLKIAKCNHWLMLSATPGDTWLDYIPVFLANGFYKNRTQFKEEHVIYAAWSKYPKVDRYVHVGKLVRNRHKILVKMPYKNESERVEKTRWVSYDLDKLKQVTDKLWHIYANRPLQNRAELFHVMRRVVNSDPSRIMEVVELHARHPKLVVFYNFNYELHMLRTLGRFYNVAEWNGQKHEPIPDLDSWVYLVQYTAGAEGWNCTETNAMCFYSLTYSYKQWEQAHGRIDRLNVAFPELFYYTLRSKAKIDAAVWKALKSKQSFNESVFRFKRSEFAKKEA